MPIFNWRRNAIHPMPGPIKTALKIAVETGRNMVVPYYPLCIDYTIDEVYDWLYPLYKSMLETYKAKILLLQVVLLAQLLHWGLYHT